MANNFRELLYDLRLYGFSQLRAETHSFLFGRNGLTFRIPKNPTEAGPIDHVAVRMAEWKRYKELHGLTPVGQKDMKPGMKPSDVDKMEPVQNPDDLLVEPVLEVPPSPPEPDPEPQEAVQETPVAKQKRKNPTFKTCPVPGCGGKWTGKHKMMHVNRKEWKKEYEQPSARVAAANGHKAETIIDRRTSKVTIVKASDYESIASSFEEALSKIRAAIDQMETAGGKVATAFRGLLYERNTYLKEKTENDLAMATVRALFEKRR